MYNTQYHKSRRENLLSQVIDFASRHKDNKHTNRLTLSQGWGSGGGAPIINDSDPEVEGLLGNSSMS